ncbi:uncharacterized protein LOC144662310 isoform X2 [Oculina patagonica]
MTQSRSTSLFSSAGTIISIVSVLLYLAGFLRVELKLNDHEKRITEMEELLKVKIPAPVAASKQDLATSLADKTTSSHSDSENNIRNRRHPDGVMNTSDVKGRDEFVVKLNTLLTERMTQLCQRKTECAQGPPGPPGNSGPRGPKGSLGRRGPRGRKGDKGIMGSPGKSGKQGILGPQGLKGERGIKGEKGELGPSGRPGTKGEPGESISAPEIAVSPPTLTVNENEAASFQCSASGNPQPVLAWSRNDSVIHQSTAVISAGKITWRVATGKDSGLYQCTARNILGEARGFARLTVNVRPHVTLHPGPVYVKEGAKVTLPMCHVTGYPQPGVTWSRPLGKLPQASVYSNHGNRSTLEVRNVQSDDSGEYICTASNLLGTVARRTFLVVVKLPKFTVRPPAKVSVYPGDSLTLNCSATGEPQPVISWKRHGSQLPVGRSHVLSGVLTLRNFRKEDAGIYICVATSAGVFEKTAVSNIQVTPSDCSTLLKAGHTQSGEYTIDPDGRGKFKVYCDMRTDGGGWTVFQRRQDGSVDFYRGWNDYKVGFGQLTGEFWLGNDKIHRLTASRPSSLRVELEDWNGVRAYAKYRRFGVGDEQSLYKLEVGSYSGTAGDSLWYHNNMAFSTKDRDNDKSSLHCAVHHTTGGWWFDNCHRSLLNGKYLGDNSNEWKGVIWYAFRKKLSLKFTEMKLKSSS